MSSKVHSLQAKQDVKMQHFQLSLTVVFARLGSCQKRGVAYPRLPYLRRGETMLFDVRVPLVIRPEVTTNG